MRPRQGQVFGAGGGEGARFPTGSELQRASGGGRPSTRAEGGRSPRVLASIAGHMRADDKMTAGQTARVGDWLVGFAPRRKGGGWPVDGHVSGIDR